MGQNHVPSPTPPLFQPSPFEVTICDLKSATFLASVVDDQLLGAEDVFGLIPVPFHVFPERGDITAPINPPALGDHGFYSMSNFSNTCLEFQTYFYFFWRVFMRRNP